MESHLPRPQLDNPAPRNLAAEVKLIRDCMGKQKSEPGDIVYLISKHWYSKWKKFVDYKNNKPAKKTFERTPPSSIEPSSFESGSTSLSGSCTSLDSLDLRDSPGPLELPRAPLTARSDPVMLPEDAWRILKSRYGAENEDGLKRIVRERGTAPVHPLSLKLLLIRDPDRIENVQTPSIINSPLTAVSKLAMSFGGEPKRLFRVVNGQLAKLGFRGSTPLGSCGFSDKEPIVGVCTGVDVENLSPGLMQKLRTFEVTEEKTPPKEPSPPPPPKEPTPPPPKEPTPPPPKDPTPPPLHPPGSIEWFYSLKVGDAVMCPKNRKNLSELVLAKVVTIKTYQDQIMSINFQVAGDLVGINPRKEKWLPVISKMRPAGTSKPPPKQSDKPTPNLPKPKKEGTKTKSNSARFYTKPAELPGEKLPSALPERPAGPEPAPQKQSSPTFLGPTSPSALRDRAPSKPKQASPTLGPSRPPPILGPSKPPHPPVSGPRKPGFFQPSPPKKPPPRDALLEARKERRNLFPWLPAPVKQSREPDEKSESMEIDPAPPVPNLPPRGPQASPTASETSSCPSSASSATSGLGSGFKTISPRNGRNNDKRTTSFGWNKQVKQSPVAGIHTLSGKDKPTLSGKDKPTPSGKDKPTPSGKDSKRSAQEIMEKLQNELKPKNSRGTKVLKRGRHPDLLTVVGPNKRRKVHGPHKDGADKKDSDVSPVIGPQLPPGFKRKSNFGVSVLNGHHPKTNGFHMNGSSSYLRKSGVSGIPNLGNTCFMNSDLQCLFYTIPLRKFFKSGDWHNDVNKDNPLGMKGQLAKAFANLVRSMESGDDIGDSVYRLKQTICHYTQRFSGYQQHDSSDFLIQLLDGLHEDLNRVREKPYVEIPDSNGRPDHIVAAEAWKNHLRRNKSRIVDLFQGQTRSEVKCPTCDHESIRFDTLMHLSLPMRSPSQSTIRLNVVPWKGEWKVVPIELPRGTTWKELEKLVIRRLPDSSRTDRLHFLGIPNKNLHENATYKQIRDKNVIAFGLPKNTGNMALVKSCYECVQKQEHIPSWRRIGGHANRLRTQLFECQQPAFVRVPLDERDVDEAKKAICKQVALSFLAAGCGEYKMIMKELMSRKLMLSRLRLLSKDRMPTRRKAVKAECTNPNCDRGYCSGCEIDQFLWKKLRKAKPRSLHISLKFGETPGRNYIPERFDGLWNRVKNESVRTKGSKLTIMDCLKFFTEKEQLTAANSWYCSKCKEHKQASKKLGLWKLPSFLIIGFKRFKEEYFGQRKNGAFVDFPLTNLDLRPFVLDPGEKKNAKYDLYAVSNHYGSMGGGHYTAFAKHKGQWWDLDDSSTKKVDPKDVVTSAAYVLFYRRRDREQE